MVKTRLQPEQKMGSLTLLRKEQRGKRWFWHCQCECGNQVWRRDDYLKKAGEKCTCGEHEKSYAKGDSSVHWKGCGELNGQYFSELRNKAEKANRPFNLSIDEAWTIFERQNRLCALSGLPLSIIGHREKKRGDFEQTASLDRIDSESSLGYCIENVQWVHKDVNRMKNDFSQKYFVETCKLVVEKYDTEHSFFSGEKVGRLILSNKIDGRWLCRCECGAELMLGEEIFLEELGLDFNCGCVQTGCRSLAGNTGVGNMSGFYFSATKCNAKNREIPFNITKHDMWDAFVKQKGRCVLTGQWLVFYPIRARQRGFRQTASIDRIDPLRPYEPDNIQWVHSDINLMKNAFSMERYLEICRLVSEKHPD